MKCPEKGNLQTQEVSECLPRGEIGWGVTAEGHVVSICAAGNVLDDGLTILQKNLNDVLKSEEFYGMQIIPEETYF